MATVSSSVISPSPRAVGGRDSIQRRPETPTSRSSRKPPLVSPQATPVLLPPPQQQRGAETTPRHTRASNLVPALSSPPVSALRSPRYTSEGSGSKRRVMVSPSRDFRRSMSDDCVAGNPLEHSPISQAEMKSGLFHLSVDEDDHVRVVEVTEFHQYIYDRDWKMLEKALKKFNGRYYQRLRERAEQQREKSQLHLTKDKSNQSIETDNILSGSDHQSLGSDPPTRMSLAWRSKSVLDLLPMSRSSQRLIGENGQEKVTVSPLLKVDEEGRTPLHLAYLNECPAVVLLELQNEEPLAVKQQDNYHQLPLHAAMIHKWPYPLIEKLIKIHPNALREKDQKGRTPLGYSVELTIGEQQEIFKDFDSALEFHWGKPVNETEKAWQFGQMKLWNKVEFLLKDLMRRKKNVMPSEHGLLLEAIKVGAPSKVINLFLSRTGKYLKLDDDFAGNCLITCVGRQYSLDTLEHLVENCKQGTTVIQDYTEKTLMTHYRRGCQPIAPNLPSFGKEIIDWCKANPSWTTEVDPERTHVSFLTGASVRCQEWWAMLRYLLFFAAYGKDFAANDKGIKDNHILHAALSISTSQPSLLQLLLAIFPESRNELCPLSKALPVHLVCTRWRYDALRSDKDTSMEKVLKVFLKADATQVVRRYKGRLPLHIALIVGQSWGFVKSFIHFDKASVGMRDPQSKMFPFQLAAVKLSSKSLAMVLRQRYTPTEWKNTPPSQKQIEFDLAQDHQSKRQIGTIYELLRRHPRAIAGRPLCRGPSKVQTETEILNAGQISMQYLSLVYDRDEDGWSLNATHGRLRDSITNGSIARPLAAWWNQMKDNIWETTPSDMAPLSDEYLLHAALYNPDTPPTIIELLLALFPMAASKPVPGTCIYPLHIAAGTVPYHPQKFEGPYSISSLELTLNAYMQATRVRVNRQLPIHIALSRGKTWKEIEPLIRQDRQSLWVRDPISTLTPVEHMASYCISSFNNMYRFSQIVDYETHGMDIDELPVSERACVLRGVKKKFDLDVLSTIYELLRRAPSALLSQQLGGDNNSSVPSVTIASSSFSEDTNEATEKKLQRLVQERPVMLPKRAVTLASYIEGTSPSNTMRFPPEHFGVLDEEFPSHEPSSCSLSSNTGAAHLFDDYTKPSYDDDNVSSMGTSMASLGLMSPLAGGPSKLSSGTPRSFESTTRYRLPPTSRTGLPNVPNLDESRHRDDI